MAIEFRHLKYFVVLADELHFGRAAKRLHISQPPLSFNIKQLEQTLEVQLLVRSSKGVALTPAGESFRQSAQQLLAQTESAITHVRDVGAGFTSRVRIGFVGSMLFRGMPQRLSQFQAMFPSVQIELTEGNSSDQLAALAAGKLDLGFVHTDRIAGDLAQRLYMSEPFVLCVHEAHPLAGGQHTIAATDEGPSDVQMLTDTPLVLFSKGASPDYYERVMAACRLLGWQPRVRHEVRHWLSVVALVRKNMGAALVPAALMDSAMGGVVYRALPPLPVVSEVYMVWRRKRVPERLLECFES